MNLCLTRETGFQVLEALQAVNVFLYGAGGEDRRL
jgi:hypothetical protein